MLASITPLGERSRRQSWHVTVTSLALAAGAAGAAGGAALAAVGSLLPLSGRTRLEVVLLVAAAAVALELRPFGLAVRSSHRQVDETWLHRYRGWVYGAGFGAQLGIGVATIVVTPAVYVALVAELLAPSVTAGAAIGAAFGLGRGVSAFAAARVTSPSQLARFHGRFERAERPAHAAAIAAQAVVLVVGLVAL
ncbi:MAG TPA: hypothetical protein VI408_01305 [Gaiellaceae bacterium]